LTTLTNKFPTSRRTEAPRQACVKRGPWLAIVIAIIAVISIIAGESWALRQTPKADGSVSSAVASDLDRVLARVAETSVLIGPMD
jgi:hypothetical protein